MQVARVGYSDCLARRELAEQFAISARLFAEAVVMLTRPPDIPHPKYEALRASALEAQHRAEAAAVAFEEHVDTHDCHPAGM